MQEMIILTQRDLLFSFIDIKSEFCRDDDLIALPRQGTSQNPFTMTCTIICSSVEKADAEIQRPVNRSNRFFIVHIAPAALSIEPAPRTADCPTSQSQRTDLQIRSPQRSLKDYSPGCVSWGFCCSSHLIFLLGFFQFLFCHDLFIDFNLVVNQFQMFVQFLHVSFHFVQI